MPGSELRADLWIDEYITVKERKAPVFQAGDLSEPNEGLETDLSVLKHGIIL